LPVAALIAKNFFTPQCGVSFWFQISTAAVAMPKAAIHEHRQF
jgi:hypothetical protein